MPTNVAVASAWVARGSLSQWKEMIVDFVRCLDFSSLFSPAQGDPPVYCRTSLRPRRTSSLALALVSLAMTAEEHYFGITHPIEYVFDPNV